MGTVPQTRVMLPPPPAPAPYRPGDPIPPGMVFWGGALIEAPKPIRFVCSKRKTKLLLFFLIAILAGMTLIMFFAFPILVEKQIAVTIMTVIILFIVYGEYAVLAQNCSVDPLTGLIHCENQLHSIDGL